MARTTHGSGRVLVRIRPQHGTPFNDLPNNAPGTVLPATRAGAQLEWRTFEAHYVYNPQLIIIGRYELERMSQQANTTNAGNLGNISSYTIGFR